MKISLKFLRLIREASPAFFSSQNRFWKSFDFWCQISISWVSSSNHWICFTLFWNFDQLYRQECISASVDCKKLFLDINCIPKVMVCIFFKMSKGWNALSLVNWPVLPDLWKYRSQTSLFPVKCKELTYVWHENLGPSGYYDVDNLDIIYIQSNKKCRFLSNFPVKWKVYSKSDRRMGRPRWTKLLIFCYFRPHILISHRVCFINPKYPELSLDKFQGDII